jgi:hypothetical protein
LQDYYKDKDHNPFTIYENIQGGDTGALIAYTSSNGTEVESKWTPEMIAELADAASYAMNYAAAGKGKYGDYGSGWFAKEGSHFAKAMYGWLD